MFPVLFVVYMGDEEVGGWGGGEDLVFLQTVDVKYFHQLGWGGGSPPQPPLGGILVSNFFILSFVVAQTRYFLYLLCCNENRRLHSAHLCTVFGNMFWILSVHG